MKAKVPSKYVQVFLETEPEPRKMVEALAHLAPPQNAKEEAILATFQTRLGLCSIEKLRRLVSAAYEEESDPELHILLILGILRFLLQGERIHDDEFFLLLRRAKSLLTAKTSPVLRAWILAEEGELTIRKGNLVLGLQQLEDTLEMCPLKSPHRLAFEFTGALRYLCLGMGSPASRHHWQTADNIYQVWLRVGQFVNDALLGNLDKALDRLADLEKETADRIIFPMRAAYNAAVQFVQLLKWEKQPGPMEREGDAAWIISSRYLLRRQAAEALRWSREHASQKGLEGGYFGFDEYTLIRAELASGHVNAAQRIMTRRRESGTQLYFDDFFLARIEQLLGNDETAARHFSELLILVEKYGAQNRLDFEIRLAPEIAAKDLIRWGRYPSPKTPAGPTAQTHAVKPNDEPASLISISASMAAVKELIGKLSSLSAPVLITGETGTGKEMVARALHDSGPRAEFPFIALNCGAVTETLIETELFGHLRGAFTGAEQTHRGLFEEAGQGTLFLDEIAEIAPKLQVALLRVLELGEYRPVGTTKMQKIQCRVVAATNSDLETQVQEGKFRKDLMFRLKRLEIQIPPLRDRPEDIPILAAAFLDQGRPTGLKASLSPSLLETLSRYPWPGNVRELKNAIERMRLLNSDQLSYDEKDLTLAVLPQRRGPDLAPAPPDSSIPSAGAALADKNLRRFPHLRRREDKLMSEIYALFQKYKKMRAYQINELARIAPSTTTRYLKMLCEAELIRKVAPNSSPISHFFILNEREP